MVADPITTSILDYVQAGGSWTPLLLVYVVKKLNKAVDALKEAATNQDKRISILETRCEINHK